jgi:hypothetical protein
MDTGMVIMQLFDSMAGGPGGEEHVLRQGNDGIYHVDAL